ncbi:MAG: phosphate ABC transporter substrate-binding protein [Rhodovulum sulfidophilum]|uniref:Phosphate ABC transporter substrate-binding protein n=1 Tax=Rhodovulum sulfidophilum TaxID=35806 RepID=A0A2W5NB65_RHOSU|nr:MAG: phosphate ABC transporter substrate-binding protein [Rhodovulum sulfidophilum]
MTALGAVSVVLGLALLSPGAVGAQSRDRARVVGSSTVFPYSQAVAEQYVGRSHAKAPVVEATGTGGGLKIFCGGIGVAFPDITGASRPITASEYRDCASNGVEDVTEALIGLDGLSLTQSLDGPAIAVTRRELFLALAADVPVDGRLAPNPYRRWSEIDPALPDMEIQVFGPPPTSGTRDALVDLVMHPGCAGFPEIAALEPERREAVCSRMRQDGPFIEAGENDNIIVQRLLADPTTVGLFGYSFLYENGDLLRGVPIDGVAPTIETLSSGAYELTRPLYLYVKNPHRGVIPGLEELLDEYLSEEAIGPDGYLVDRGLVPLSAEARARVRADVAGRVHPRRFDAEGAE